MPVHIPEERQAVSCPKADGYDLLLAATRERENVIALIAICRYIVDDHSGHFGFKIKNKENTNTRSCPDSDLRRQTSSPSVWAEVSCKESRFPARQRGRASTAKNTNVAHLHRRFNHRPVYLQESPGGVAYQRVQKNPSILYPKRKLLW